MRISDWSSDVCSSDLTEHGAEYAGRIRHHLDQIEKDTFGLVSRSGMGRSLHIAVLPTLATTWLVPRLPDFQRLHGDIAVSLSVRTLPFQFNDHPFDGAIYHASQIWPQTAGIRWFDAGRSEEPTSEPPPQIR